MLGTWAIKPTRRIAPASVAGHKNRTSTGPAVLSTVGARLTVKRLSHRTVDPGVSTIVVDDMAVAFGGCRVTRSLPPVLPP
eukprot:CAMPEP_0182941878 /NCGR_PEP_ID=MMETSP0105_2-20130417/49638_1 /TAXON_ID=81532 ORGANISM="Acanthoeca-like sp., Strain 10tr" /NCGR_SAMPLE_ID=MMETSP0105_2 /ASSEMBLY_ACC=CAM_ASM_000205 /LENGTH=80 /DNA_ID=CAMNT_0025081545 /DNA_START=159 /DNA_END=401 /DNA_ORIENTATION=+